ncbi:transcriptional regulator [Candidatus Regiella endosymbiont of Tuberolachnus salignus]|uniref:winged helix-turn-helix domain-containing protein n=1 Tax=Candidatus Regiella endosymbiont of Tuberolachnus salignus TaxID=3077956 RepID=UPI0030D26AA4
MKKRLYSVNNWRIDLYSGCMTHQYSGETRRLGEYQLKLLDILLQHAGEILSRDQLTHLVWEKRVIGNNSLPNAIHTLRSALNDNKKQQRIIQTIPKKGYLFDASYCIAIEQEDPSSANENIHPKNIPFAFEVAARRPGRPTDERRQLRDSASTRSQQRGGFKGEGYNLTDDNNHDADKDQNKQYQDNNSAFQPAEKDRFQLTVTHSPNFNTKKSILVSWWLLAKKIFLLARVKIIFTLLLTIAVSGCILFVINPHSHSSPHFFAEEQKQNLYSHIRLFQIKDMTQRIKNEDDLHDRLKDTLFLLNKNSKAKKMRLSIYYHLSLRKLDYTFVIENDCKKQQLNMSIYHWRLDNKNLNHLIYRETERKMNEMLPCDN